MFYEIGLELRIFKCILYSKNCFHEMFILVNFTCELCVGVGVCAGLLCQSHLFLLVGHGVTLSQAAPKLCSLEDTC